MKKVLRLFLCIILLIGLCSCKKEDKKIDENNDAVIFKEEYESLNGKEDYVKVSIKDNNYFIYVDSDKLSNLLNASAFIFIGSATDNESRNIVNVLDYVNSSSIYYIDIDDVNDEVKSILNNNGISLDKPTVIGVLNGEIIKYQEGTGHDTKELTEDEKSELKLIYDDINAKVSGDACDIDAQGDC